MGQKQATQIWREEPHQSDGDARPEVAFHHMRIDVRPGQKRQHDRAEASDVIDPGCQRQANRVARNGAHDNLEQGG